MVEGFEKGEYLPEGFQMACSLLYNQEKDGLESLTWALYKEYGRQEKSKTHASLSRSLSCEGAVRVNTLVVKKAIEGT